MNLTDKKTIKNLLKKYGAKPEKYLGQHFILSKKSLVKMIAATEIPHPLKKGGGLNDIIVEIGPGLGTLTRELAATGAKIITVEKDPLMIKILKETVVNHKNVKIIQADARQSSGKPTRNPTSGGLGISGGKNGYKIVANLPYNIATFLIRQWLELQNPPELMILMIQKEVARRIIAKPPHSNLLGMSIQFYADVKIINYVKKELFWPKPKVDAAIIKIAPRKKPSVINREVFFKVLKAGFSSPRKQLVGNLSKNLNIPKEEIIFIFKNLGVPEQTRAENLDLNHWQNLASRLIHN